MPGVGVGPGPWRRLRRIPQSIQLGGVTYFLLRDDVTGAVLFDDATNQPLYG